MFVVSYVFGQELEESVSLGTEKSASRKLTIALECFPVFLKRLFSIAWSLFYLNSCVYAKIFKRVFISK
jgi:hypothetical protein